MSARVITYTVTLGASKAERERRLLEAAGEMGIGPNDTVVQLFELADDENLEPKTEVRCLV
jgi:hypothetical protein